MPPDIKRLLAPRSIALIGSSAWTDAVAAGNAAVGFEGTLWRVHPSRPSTESVVYYRDVDALPDTPDAAFIAVPNHDVAAIAGALAARNAGGFVCFTAGFSETGAAPGMQMTADLVRSAGTVPYFGPNCYGFVNFFDGAALLPDQVVGARVGAGVAIICQSGTIALTMMFNQRSVPIGYLLTVGNQTCLAVEDLIDALCDDPRVTAFGLYVEGVKNPAAFVRAVDKARAAGKPIAMVKSGRTAAAARTAHSHTGALAGEDTVFDAFCRQAGIARCDTLSTLCETLKVFHTGGVLRGTRTLVMGASGGDMAMTADVARALDLDFMPIPPATAATLQRQLTDRVTIANPLDLHTYLWFDPPALGRVFATALGAGYDAVSFMLDRPPELEADTSSYDVVIDEFIDAARHGGTRAALIASLPETISTKMRERCLAGGVVPLQGQREALEALALAGAVGRAWAAGPDVRLQTRIATLASDVVTLSEADGKAALAGAGVAIPRNRIAALSDVAGAAASIGYPLVIKALGAHLEHKTELGGVQLNVRSAADALAAAQRMTRLSETFLVEEMLTDGVAEVLVGVVVDAQFGQVLVVGSGGVLTELLADSVSVLPPWTRTRITHAVERLSVTRLLRGYRGKAAGDIAALLDVVMGVASYASDNVANLVEIDVNPVIVRPLGKGAVAVDALIRRHQVNE